MIDGLDDAPGPALLGAFEFGDRARDAEGPIVDRGRESGLAHRKHKATPILASIDDSMQSDYDSAP